MKILIVGATGYIGNALAEHLVGAGHDVRGTARSQAGVERLQSQGITPVHLGAAPESLLIGNAIAADATINVSDADNLPLAQLLVGAITGTGKMLIHTSGSSIVVDDAEGEFATDDIYEDDAPFTPLPHRLPRVGVDQFVRSAGITHGIRTAVICPTTVYGYRQGLEVDSDQLPRLVTKTLAQNAGVYIGKGQNIWSHVFLGDLCELYELALHKAPSASFFFAENGESTYHAIGEALSRRFGFKGKVESWDIDSAIAEIGLLARAGLASNCRVRSTNAKRILGWKPTGPGLLEVIANSPLVQKEH